MVTEIGESINTTAGFIEEKVNLAPFAAIPSSGSSRVGAVHIIVRSVRTSTGETSKHHLYTYLIS